MLAEQSTNTIGGLRLTFDCIVSVKFVIKTKSMTSARIRSSAEAGFLKYRTIVSTIAMILMNNAINVALFFFQDNNIILSY
jgi:hypothetical protein